MLINKWAVPWFQRAEANRLKGAKRAATGVAMPAMLEARLFYPFSSYSCITHVDGTDEAVCRL